MSDSFDFTRHNRNPRTVTILICIYAALIGAVILIDAAWWLMAVLGLFTLPALWDLYADTSAGLSITEHKLEWFTGKRSADLDLDKIDHMRFDTRMDMSVRVTAVLHSGEKVRLPYEALPPHRRLETEFQNRDLRVIRHHFALF